jgi:hypothetical protein
MGERVGLAALRHQVLVAGASTSQAVLEAILAASFGEVLTAMLVVFDVSRAQAVGQRICSGVVGHRLPTLRARCAQAVLIHIVRHVFLLESVTSSVPAIGVVETLS